MDAIDIYLSCVNKLGNNDGDILQPDNLHTKLSELRGDCPGVIQS